VLGGAGDQGVDVIVNRGSERIAVQCKNHRKVDKLEKGKRAKRTPLLATLPPRMRP